MLTLLVSVLTVTVSVSSVVHTRPYSRAVKRDVDRNPAPGTMHNVTIDCGQPERAAFKCLGDLRDLASQGFPWLPASQDALGYLNHVCDILYRSETCLREHAIPDFCLTTLKEYHTLIPDFQFICNNGKRDENLIHSLQCLHDKRVLVMLYFDLADRSGSFDLLDDAMRRKKRAYFYSLNVYPPTYRPYLPPLYCLKRSAISTCVRPLVDERCGLMAADLTQEYLIYTQDWVGQALSSVGLYADICENDIPSAQVKVEVPR